MFTLVGAFLGGWAFGPLGAFIGGTLGSMIDFALWDPKSQAGKPLETLNHSTSIEGETIPYIYGKARTGMKYVWISPLKSREMTQTIEQTRFLFIEQTKEVPVGWAYYGSLVAIACHGPIKGISRIWNNDTGELVYDKREGVSDEVAGKSDDWASAFQLEILYGTDDQSRVSWMDQEIQEALDRERDSSGGITSVLDVPEYKNYAGIAVRNIDFPNGRIPNLSIEVIGAGYSTPQEWEQVIPTSTYWGNRSMAGVAVINRENTKEVYVVGGWKEGTAYWRDIWVTENMKEWKSLPNMPMQNDKYGFGRYQFDMWGFYISNELRTTIEGASGISLADNVSEGNYLFVMGGATKTSGGTPNVWPIIYKRNASSGAVEKYITGFAYNIEREYWFPIIVHAGDPGVDLYGAFQNVVPWPRYAYASCVHNGYVYITGGKVSDFDDYTSFFLNGDANNAGHAFDNKFGGTWRSSSGGITWEEIGSIGSYEYRSNHYMVSHKGTLFMGGGDSSHPNMANPISEKANALYKLINGHTWSLVNINMAAHTCRSINVSSSNYTVTLTNTVNVDYSELLVVGHIFKIYDSQSHPITGYGYYTIGSVTKSGNDTIVTVDVAEQSTFESETTGVSFISGYFECPLYQTQLGSGGTNDLGIIWGMAEYGNGLVALVETGNNIYPIISTDGGESFTELVLSGSIPEYGTVATYPEFNTISFFSTVYTMGGELLAEGLINEIWRINTPLFGSSDVYLDDVVKDICNRRQIENSYVDASSLSGIVVGGFVSDALRGDEEINHLRRVYRFDYWEEDGKLVFKLRNRSSDVTIPEDDLAATNKEEYQNKLIIDESPELDLPMQVRLQYIDENRDYQSGSQISKRIISDSNDNRVTTANKMLDIQVPIVLTANQAYQAANEILWDMWNTRRTVTFTVSQKYLEYDPGTISVINNSNEQYIVRWRKVDISTPGLMKISGLITDLGLYSADLSDGGVDSEGETTRETGDIISVVSSDYIFLDVPIVHKVWDDFGFYVAATPSNGDFDNWIGAEVYISRNDGSDWAKIADVPKAALVGVTEASFGTGSAKVWDDDTEITVKMTHKIDMASCADTEVMAGRNIFAIGDEIIGVSNIEFTGYTTSGGVTYSHYKFTRLARGLYGTEYQRISHLTSGENVVMMVNVYRVPLQAEDQNETYKYKIMSKGQRLGDVSSVSFTCNSIGRYLPSPAGVHAKRHWDGTWEFWWNRRGRVFDLFDPYDQFNRMPDLEKFYVGFQDSGGTFLPNTPLFEITADEPRIKLEDDDWMFTFPQYDFQIVIHQVSRTHGLSHPVVAKVNLDGVYDENYPNFLSL